MSEADLGAPRPLTELTEDEAMFRATVAEFAARRVAPLVADMDRTARYADGLVAELFGLGLMGIEVPVEHGGAGSSLFATVLAIEELAKVDPAVALAVDVQNTVVDKALLRWGSNEQRARYLPDLCRAMLGAYALSEAGSGSDAFALATRATRDGDVWRLNGRKLWITNAAEAGLFVVFATVDPAEGYRGISAFLVERDRPGLAIGKREDKLGVRASSTCEVILEDCPVPAANVLGALGQGYKIAIELLNEGRIGIGAQLVGLADGALAHAVRYAGERRQFGRPIGEFQGLQFQLAEMAIDVESARLLVYDAARLCDAGRPFRRRAAMAKYHASQVAERVASRALEVFGGLGFTKDLPMEKLYRDAKIGKIYEGTSNIQLQTIAKMLLGGER
jgi:butyryl-CoA dehydrogenase/short/branched chain acyl-CoA dehydrogenase